MTTLLVYLPNVPHPSHWLELPGIAPVCPLLACLPQHSPLEPSLQRPEDGGPFPTFPWPQGPCSTDPTCGTLGGHRG